MKKFVVVLIVLVSLVVPSFALGKRIFEVKLDTSFGASNSSFAIDDIFKKEIVIDLPEIANMMPERGFSVDFMMAPKFEMGLNLKKLNVRISTGLEAQGSFILSKSFFDFLAKGNELNKPIEIGLDLYTDVFSVFDTTIEFRTEKLNLSFVPGFYTPLFHMRTGKSSIVITNSSDGKFGIDMNTGLELYTPIDSKFMPQNNLNGMSDIGSVLGEIFTSGYAGVANNLGAALFGGMGFDLAAESEYNFLLGLKFTLGMRIPIVPGHLPTKTSTSLSMKYEMGLMDILGDNFSAPSADDFKFSGLQTEESPFYLSRPFKFDAGVRWSGFRNCINLYATAGLGVRYPYTDYAIVYPEYLIYGEATLFNTIGLSLATQYIDQIFSNQLVIILNSRVFEIDLGVSLQSATFVGSFRLSGATVYLAVSTGF